MLSAAMLCIKILLQNVRRKLKRLLLLAALTIVFLLVTLIIAQHTTGFSAGSFTLIFVSLTSEVQRFVSINSVNVALSKANEREAKLLGLRRITDDTSIACRHFDIPVWGVARTWHDLESTFSPVDCAQNRTFTPWVVVKPGAVAVIDQTPGNDINCSFAEYIYVDDYNFDPAEIAHSTSHYQLTHGDTVAVKCTNNKDNETWEDVLLAARQNANTDLLPLILNPKSLQDHPKMPIQNVLIWMFDAVSKNSFVRNLPKTWAFMEKKMGGIFFKGFNVHGFNSLPNIIPFWTGKLVGDWLPRDRNPKHVNDFPPPFIISEYSNKGYVTAYYEDDQYDTGYDTYLIHQAGLKGFSKPPAHYYSRTFMQTRYALKGDKDPLCIGNKSSNTHAQDYMKALWTLHEGQRKFFFFNQVTYTHSSLTDLHTIDSEMEQFLREWVNSPAVRDNSLVAIMSDHGNHLFKAVNLRTVDGYLEQKMPLLYLLLPDWMNEKHPSRMANMRKNAAERLTTHADLHQTLSHLLKFDRPDERTRIAQSLFTPIPKERTCSDAGIQPSFCACNGPVEMNHTSDQVKKWAEQAMETMNEHVKDELDTVDFTSILSTSTVSSIDGQSAANFSHPTVADISRICQPWKFESVQHAWQIAKGQMIEGRGDYEYYLLSVVANPGHTTFKFTMKRAPGEKIQLVLDSVIREGQYSDKAKCVVQFMPTLGKWCYCY